MARALSARAVYSVSPARRSTVTDRRSSRAARYRPRLTRTIARRTSTRAGSTPLDRCQADSHHARPGLDRALAIRQAAAARQAQRQVQLTDRDLDIAELAQHDRRRLMGHGG